MSDKQKKNRMQLALTLLIILSLAAFVFCKREANPANKNSSIFIDVIADSVLNETKTLYIMTQKEILIGKIESSNESLALIPLKYASREGIYMNKEAFEAFLEMYNAAKEAGIKLQILSGFRSFNHQKAIWENKWHGRQTLTGNIKATDIEDKLKRAKEILKYSAMPGTSRHHWGTDIDLNSLNNNYFESGEGKKVYDWLNKNAGIYGFCRPYNAKGNDRLTGYEEEKWHWSYMPVAKKYLSDYIETIIYEDIEGFAGDETAITIGVIEKYVSAINPDCKSN